MLSRGGSSNGSLVKPCLPGLFLRFCRGLRLFFLCDFLVGLCSVRFSMGYINRIFQGIRCVWGDVSHLRPYLDRRFRAYTCSLGSRQTLKVCKNGFLGNKLDGTWYPVMNTSRKTKAFLDLERPKKRNQKKKQSGLCL